MGKRLPSTPRSRVRAALRQLWLRSRERAAAIKRESNTCEVCGAKGSVAKGKECKIEVHHNCLQIANWEAVIDAVYRHILCPPEHLTVVCRDCHKKVHETGEL